MKKREKKVSTSTTLEKKQTIVTKEHILDSGYFFGGPKGATKNASQTPQSRRYDQTMTSRPTLSNQRIGSFG